MGRLRREGRAPHPLGSPPSRVPPRPTAGAARRAPPAPPRRQEGPRCSPAPRPRPADDPQATRLVRTPARASSRIFLAQCAAALLPAAAAPAPVPRPRGGPRPREMLLGIVGPLQRRPHSTVKGLPGSRGESVRPVLGTRAPGPRVARAAQEREAALRTARPPDGPPRRLRGSRPAFWVPGPSREQCMAPPRTRGPAPLGSGQQHVGPRPLHSFGRTSICIGHAAQRPSVSGARWLPWPRRPWPAAPALPAPQRQTLLNVYPLQHVHRVKRFAFQER